jgi:hypothetical protein
MDANMITVDNILHMARSAGVTVLVDGYDLVLEHDANPPADLVAICRRFKPELVRALRMRQAEQHGLVARWINEHFVSSPSGVCTHCGDGLRSGDDFVRLFVGSDQGEVHASCHSAWRAEREAEARRALRLDHDENYPNLNWAKSEVRHEPRRETDDA